MPPTLPPLRRRSSLARTRSRHGGLSRSLEDLHASLLRAGARKAGITTLRKGKPFAGDDIGATPHSTTFPLELPHFVTNKQHSSDHRPPPLTARCLHAFNDEIVEENACPPSPARASPSAPTAICVSEWVWGVEDGKGFVKVDGGGKKGETRLLNRDAAGDASKMLFLDKDDPASSTFDSVCSTVAPTERTLSISEDRPSSLVLDTATAPKIPTKDSSECKEDEQSNKLQVEGDALDAPFLDRLCDMSVRFPEPPEKDVPATSSKTRVLTTRGLRVKSLMFALPALPLIFGHKSVLGSKRRRKSVALWKARSEATTSMEVSFQQKLSRAKDAFGSKEHADAKDSLVSKGSQQQQSRVYEKAPGVPPPPQAVAPKVPLSLPRNSRKNATLSGQQWVNPYIRHASSQTLVGRDSGPAPVAKETWVWSEKSAPRKEGGAAAATTTRRNVGVSRSGVPRDPRRGGGGGGDSRVVACDGAGRSRSRRVLVVTPIMANALKRRDFLVH